MHVHAELATLPTPCTACPLAQDGELKAAAESLSAKEEALQALQADHAALNSKATACSVRCLSCLDACKPGAVVTDILILVARPQEELELAKGRILAQEAEAETFKADATKHTEEIATLVRLSPVCCPGNHSTMPLKILTLYLACLTSV